MIVMSFIPLWYINFSLDVKLVEKIPIGKEIITFKTNIVNTAFVFFSSSIVKLTLKNFSILKYIYTPIIKAIAIKIEKIIKNIPFKDFSSSIFPSARYFVVYLSIVFPKPKFRIDIYPIID